MYTEEEIRRFLAEIEFYELNTPVILKQLSLFELTKICNGWGSDSWPRPLRKALSRIAGAYDVLAIPHDVRFEFKEGSAELADAEFYWNGKKIWRKRWKFSRFWNPYAWYEFWKLRAAYKALTIFSRIAWEK